MMSMTGFGRGRCVVGGRGYVVEIRSVNHRFLELKSRLPWSDPLIEQQLGAAVRQRLSRGAVTVLVRDEGGATGSVEVRVDVELARAFAAALSQLAAACDVAERPSLALLAAQPGVLTVGSDESDPEKVWAQLVPGVVLALEDLSVARAREGASLGADLAARSQRLRQVVAELGRLAADAPSESRRRLEERLRKLLAPGDAVHIDPQRLAQEVALLADRTDITEEITRFNTHLDEVDRLLSSGEPAGRRLDFLAQELNREANTMGSKSQRSDIATRVIEAKAELERLREQVQNLE
jgi:uncharacterized protein (TIGR00255 family)